MPVHFDQSVLDAYLETEYVLSNNHQIFKIGHLHHKQERFFQSFGVQMYAWITAWNPKSVKLHENENKKRMTNLINMCTGEMFFDGFSRNPDGSWEERGLWLCNADLDKTRKLAVEFDQNAFTFAIMGHAMKLIMV